jgi:hypothetical protein
MLVSITGQQSATVFGKLDGHLSALSNYLILTSTKLPSSLASWECKDNLARTYLILQALALSFMI